MKKLIVTLSVILITTFAGIAQENHDHHKKNQVNDVITKPASPMGKVDEKVTASIKVVVAHYLHMKDALTKDNSKDAAAAGKAIVDAIGKVDKSAMTAEQKNNFDDIADDTKENAEHIGANADKIAHQREHFDLLSKDIYDLTKAFGAGQTLYKNFCPMYNKGKGAFWLSDSKTIKNPYYGKQMLTCGSVKEEIK